MKHWPAPALLLLVSFSATAQTVWRVDSVTSIAGHPVRQVGSPKVVDTDRGRAVHFDGDRMKGDALFVDALPLQGTLTYTWEMIFRPATGGGEEQRVFHLKEEGSESRRLFEIRIRQGNKWCLDVFAENIGAERAPILNCDPAHLYPLDQWYAVAATYDGTTLRAYVDGVLQGEAKVRLLPLGKGGASLGSRYNLVDFFKGDILSARFSNTALKPAQFLKVP
ncbi:LamG domain-containing protein [Terriglobus tenax]|uniref:LamG domain-containing protein n=1 Tax=Terriglobus tenax TaxID=1111115 RepID=UPI0021DFD361|nr:LamG domain-containing protein [Terriglobus tenax]